MKRNLKVKRISRKHFFHLVKKRMVFFLSIYFHSDIFVFNLFAFSKVYKKSKKINSSTRGDLIRINTPGCDFNSFSVFRLYISFLPLFRNAL